MSKTILGALLTFVLSAALSGGGWLIKTVIDGQVHQAAINERIMTQQGYVTQKMDTLVELFSEVANLDKRVTVLEAMEKEHSALHYPNKKESD